MNSEQQAHSDMQYVRGVLESSQAFPSATPAILYLWAAIVLAGFVMMDYGMSWFWGIGGFGGGLLSMWLSRRAARRRGQIDDALAARANLHWAIGLAGGIILSAPLQISGAISEEVNGQIALLVIAICYFLAGVHLDRFMMWLGGLAVVAYGTTFFYDEVVWSIPGVLLASGLALAGGRLQSQQ